MDFIGIPDARLPVLRSVDVAVVGGSCAAVAVAVGCAHSGKRTLLVESRTYLGRDITATLRPWVDVGAGAASGFWADLIARMGLESSLSDAIPLRLDGLKLALEDICLGAGVDLLYASRPVDVIVGTGGIEGLVIGNKSGRQVIRTGTVIDATETALVARLAGASFCPVEGVERYCRTLEFDGLTQAVCGTIAVPPELSIAGDAVAVHGGYRGEGHALVEFGMRFPFEDGLGPSMAREIAARHTSMALARYLIGSVPGFEGATLATSSLELYGRQTAPLAGPQDCARPIGHVAGLWCPNEAACPQLAAGGPVAGAVLGEAVARAVVAGTDRPVEQGIYSRRGRPLRQHRTDNSPALHLTVGEPASPQRGREYELQDVSAMDLPILGRCDVLVVGGGASGASAAITAAREGMDTILLEMNGGLGGTGTLAGVHSYWYGRHAAFAETVQRLTDEVQQPLGHTKSTWNIEAKMYALLRAAEGAGARVFFNALTIGALLDGNRVRGVVAATPWGPYAVLAEVVVDATGDGDVAAFAGAPYVYGADMDGTTMWYSLGQFTRPGLTRNNFTSMVDVSNVEDYTRAILAGRRRGTAGSTGTRGIHDHSVYLAPRESRHVLAEVTMTHTDQLMRRLWPDVINIHYSNHDVKGCSTSPWVRAGLIPPNLEIEIPYRMLLPRNLDGILVTGKAIGATHDALPAIRMQADMETLGGVTALAACAAVRSGLSPREIDIRELQERLVAEDVLPEGVLCRSLDPAARTKEEMQQLVDELTGDAPLYQYSDMEMGELFEGRIPFVEVCTAGPAIVPLLEAALSRATGLRRQHLAQALAMYGRQSAVSVLIACIEEHLEAGGLPARENQIRHANYPPDQGAMPDVVYLLYSLGMVRDVRALPVWEAIVDRIDATEEDVRDRRNGAFYYVEAVCWGAEQLRDPRAIPILERLHARPALHGNVCRARFQADFFAERQAMMELMIGRALARCGSPRGLRILIEYLDDTRAPLAEGVHNHLIDITGEDHGKDGSAWYGVARW